MGNNYVKFSVSSSSTSAPSLFDPSSTYKLDFKTLKNKLGSGSLADVYKIQRKSDNKAFAVKVLKMSLEEVAKFEKMGCEKEMKSLKTIDHPNVIEHVDEFIYRDKFCIVSSFASEGDFDKII